MEKLWHKNYARGVPRSIKFDEIALPQAFDRTVKKYPDNPALFFQGTVVSYREFDGLVSRFASALRALKVKAGDKVSLVMPNLVQTVAGIYGAMRMGAVVVMHNPRNDDMLLTHQLTDAGSETVVCLDVLVPRMIGLRSKTKVRNIISCHIRDYLPFFKKQLFPLVKSELHLETPKAPNVHDYLELIEKQPADGPRHVPSLEDIAFILYTSATTGKSKGVELTHANMSKNVQQVRGWFPSFGDGREIVVGCLPFFHVFGLTCALNIGVFYGYADALVPLPEPKNILEAIHESKATFIPALPTFYLGVVNESGLKKYDLSSLKGCFSGGAPLALETIRKFESLTGAQICEGYGLTETSPTTHINPFGGKTKAGTIGLPLPDTDAKIVDVDDARIEITTPGMPGELCIRGPQVMKGYVNLPEQTEAAIKDGWLLTGDIVKMDPDGYFSVVDRKKDLIVTQAERVYPRDVDEVLFAHPKVLEACSIGVPDPSGAECAKSYVVLRKGETAAVVEILDFCRKKLPPAKVPKQLEFITDLPKSPVGKILRKELRRMHLVRSSQRPRA